MGRFLKLSAPKLSTKNLGHSKNLGLSWATFFDVLWGSGFDNVQAFESAHRVVFGVAGEREASLHARRAAHGGLCLYLGDVTKILAGGTLKPNDLAEQDPEYGRGPLHYAAFMGHVEVRAPDFICTVSIIC